MTNILHLNTTINQRVDMCYSISNRTQTLCTLKCENILITFHFSLLSKYLYVPRHFSSYFVVISWNIQWQCNFYRRLHHIKRISTAWTRFQLQLLVLPHRYRLSVRKKMTEKKQQKRNRRIDETQRLWIHVVSNESAVIKISHKHIHLSHRMM